MTFRAKPVVNRPHRPSRDSRSRRNFYLNIGFGIAVVLALIILVGVAVVSYYSEHLAPAATVNGQTITRDDFAERGAIEVWRIEQQVARVNASLAAGRLTSAEASQQIQSLNSQGRHRSSSRRSSSSGSSTAASRPASRPTSGIAVTPEQIDAKIVEESTTPAQRHAWIISIAPEIDEGKTEPTAAQKAAAKKIADQALADIKFRCKDLGGRRQGDLQRQLEGVRRRPRLDRRGRGRRRGLHRCRLRRRAGQADGRPRDRGRNVPHRSGHRNRACARGSAPGRRSSSDAGLKLESYRKVVETRGRSASRSRTRRRGGDKGRQAAARLRDRHPGAPTGTVGQGDQGPPHPLRAEGRSLGCRRPAAGGPGLDRGPAGRPGRPSTS